MNAALTTDGLARWIEARLALLEQLRDVARRQTALIDGGELVALLSLLGPKQKLLGQLQAIERQLDPYRAQDPDSRVWTSNEARVRCQQQADRCATLLSEILLLERRSEAELIGRRDAAARQLQGTHDARQAAVAYLDAPSTLPRQLDVSSGT